MNRITLTITAGLIIAPLVASAQPRDGNAMLRGQIQALGAAGFSGMTEIQVPAPATTKIVLVSVQADETTDALAGLIRKAKIPTTFDGETMRVLGIDFDGEKLLTTGIDKQKHPGGIYFFSVTNARGKTEILMAGFDSAKQERPTYLVSTDGTLVAAAITRKLNGKFQAERIPVSEAQAAYKELLEFWMRYYRDNLKNA